MKLFNEKNIKEAVALLKNGKVIVFPTETSYGIGCDATNQEAVNRIFKIKNRDSNKPLLIVVPTVDMAKKYLQWNKILESLAGKYWPGALTIVGQRRMDGELAEGVAAEDGTVAVRVTAHPIAKAFSGEMGKPLVATSANVSGAGDIFEAKELFAVFQNKMNSRMRS